MTLHLNLLHKLIHVIHVLPLLLLPIIQYQYKYYNHNNHVVLAFHTPITIPSSTFGIRKQQGGRGTRGTRGGSAVLFSKNSSLLQQRSSTKEDIDGEISSSKGHHGHSSSDCNTGNKNDPVFEDVDGIGQLMDIVVGATNTATGGVQVHASASTGSIQDDIITRDKIDVFLDTILSDVNSASVSASASSLPSSASASASLNGTGASTTITSSKPTTDETNNPSNPNRNHPDTTIVDILNISDHYDTQIQQLIDPNAVVEEIIGAGISLKVLDENRSSGGGSSNIVDSSATTNTIPSSSSSSLSADGDNELIKSYHEYQGIEEVIQEQVQHIVHKQKDLIPNTTANNNNSINSKEEQDKKIIEEENINIPNLIKIIKFAIPAVGVWLCSPLLSLIDTSSVGLLSGTAQQAALNPAVAVTDYSAMLCAFMYTATTNLVAGAKGKEEQVASAAAAAQNLDDDYDKNGKSKDLQEQQQSSPSSLTKKTLIQALQVSGYVGIIIGTFLITMGPILLRTIIGNDSIDPRVFAAALRYVRIRALGMPAAAIIGSAQSASIGMQDIKSPMYVLLAAAVVNFMGDVIFVPRANAWLGGAAGAAWATVFSQYAALGIFFKWMMSRPNKKSQSRPTVNLTKAILELTGKSDEGQLRRRKFRRALQKLGSGGVVRSGSGGVVVDGSNAFATATASVVSSSSSSADIRKEIVESALRENKSQPEVVQPRRRSRLVVKIKQILHREKKKNSPNTQKNESEKEFSIRGFLEGEEKMLLRSPTFEEAKLFWPYFIPVTTTAVGRVSAYVSMSHVVSSTLGTLSMAANQVILSVFYCLTPMADALNLTGQSFVPAIAQRKKSPARAKALRQVTNNFMKAGLLSGVGMVGAVGCIPFVSKYFTSDPAVIPLVNSIVPALSGFFAVHGVLCALEGVLLGQKDLNFLGQAYASYFFVVPYFMLRVKRMALEGVENVGLTSLWNVFCCYNIVRVLMFLFRSKILVDRARNEVKDGE